MNILMNTKVSTIALSAALTFSILATAAIGADKSNDASKQRSSTQLSVKTESGAKRSMAKITGIGGVFFQSKDSKALAEWYQKVLGLTLEPWGGAILRWKEDKAEDGGCTVWNAMAKGSEKFAPSQSGFMFNYRIDDMAKMIEQIKANGVSILQGPESHENGKFLWIVDPDGNKVELWEPKIWDDKNKGS